MTARLDVRRRAATEFYNSEDEQRYGREALPDATEDVRRLLARDASGPHDLVVDLGCGKGPFKSLGPRYVGLDLSLYALRTFHGAGRCVQADIQEVPLRDGCAGVVLSTAALEHLPSPERCLAEVDRVLRPGGVAYLAPAWFCRSWASSGLSVKPYAVLRWRDRMYKSLLPVLDSFVVRSLWIVPARIWRELRFALRPRPLAFAYRRLQPNLTEYLCADSDASVSMDPHAAIMYFLSRGYQILSASTALRRVLVRHAPVIVRKSEQGRLDDRA